MERARGNLIRAGSPKQEGVPYEDLCFDAQQAAEKALKGVHVFRGIDYEWTHDIKRLIDRLESHRISVPAELEHCDELTVYAGLARYPGTAPPTTESEWREAVELAERAVQWAVSMIGK